MKKSGKRLISLLFALVMILSMTVSAFADVPEKGGKADSSQDSAVELETEGLDPSSLHVRKLGEESEEDPDEPDASAFQPADSLDELVRVSIFLDKAGAVDAGYSANGVGTNRAAISYRDSLRAQQNSLVNSIEKKLGYSIDVKWNLTLLTNAVSAYVKVKDIPVIENMPGVKSVEKEMLYEAQKETPNTSNTSRYMIGATAAWSAGYSGAGSRIAIIDTGIDTGHQSFNADAFEYSINELGMSSVLMTKSDVTAVASQLNSKSSNYVSSKIPYGYNYVDQNASYLGHDQSGDNNGNHGSHVAGIAAANRYIKKNNSYVEAASSVLAVGMAPDAQLILMKVFGKGGGAYDSDYMAAIEDAIVLGCDAANLSLGSGSPGFTYSGSYQAIMNNLSNSEKNYGMVVAISAGNAYGFTQFLETDLYIDTVSMHTGGSPGTFINSLGVAAAQNTGATGAPLQFNGRDIYYNETESTGAAMTSITGSWSFVYIDALGETSDYSTVNRAVSLSGKIVIINRGELSFYEKGNNAISYSPKALIVANNTGGTMGMSLDDYTGTFPMVSISLADAEFIKANSTMSTTGGITYYTGTIKVTSTQTSGLISGREDAEVTEFSSWGVPGSLLMKPEITAPGGDIYSVFGTTAASNETGGTDVYGSYSGTSMAAPHIAGLSALVAQYLKENNITVNGYSRRAVIQSLLMSTATPMINDGEYVSILQQGAGLAEVSKAVGAASVIMVGTDVNDNTLTVKTGSAADGKVKAEFGDDPQRKGVYEYSFTIHNISDTDLNFALRTELFTQDSYEEDGQTFMAPTTTGIDANVTYTWEGQESTVDPHDVNKDGATDLDDAQALLDYLTGNVSGSGLDLTAGEMDGKSGISSYDVYLLIQALGETGEALSDGTVAAHSSRQVKVKISLTSAQKAALDRTYTSGAYIEGFTYVTCDSSTAEGEDLSHEHSIPLLGFYGSWTDPSMFDSTSYVNEQYGIERTPYSGHSQTNYLSLKYNGVTTKFSGNPYKVESEFPASRLAVNSSSNFVNIYYNLIRSAGTTGFAVSEIDKIGGTVTNIPAASVVANEVTGQYFSESAESWQNTGTKFYSVNKNASSFGFSEGDTFRIGFYAIPEYNAMIHNGDMTDADAGMLDTNGFKSVIASNVLGKGAFIGYDFTVDDTAPVLESATLSGSTLTVKASDNMNIAYIAVLSLDGDVVYVESTPGKSSATITLDASDAIANAPGYVAVFVGDYAGNEIARAVKVNDNAYEEKTVYVLTDTLEAGDYLIVSGNSTGNAYALGHSGTTIATNAVAIKAGTSATSNAVYIDSKDVASTSVWTAASGYTFKNGSYYLRRNNNNGTTLQAGTSNQYNTWLWSGNNSRLSMTISNRTYYLRYNNNTFSLSTTGSSVYLFRKTTIRTEIDPYEVTSVEITPASLDLYKGNEEDVVAKVLHLTANDRTVNWSTSNSSVATVDQNGHVRATGAGTATITAVSNAANNISASCSVNVTSVNKSLNAIVWDEDGGVYFSNFNASSLPTWNRLHSDDKKLQLHSAFMQSTSNLYAATLDSSSAETVLYSVNRNSYALTEYGTNYLWATDMAIAASTYSNYVGMAYTFAYYLIGGPIAPGDDGEGGTYCGLPYAFLDCSEVTDGAYFAGIACKSRSSQGGTFYVLDENGIIWQTTLALNSAQNGFDFSTPTKVLETGISTGFLYQSLYYDGTYLYWSHYDSDVAELIIINPSSGKVYHAGNFGESVWPAAGLYVNGSVAPASAGTDEPLDIDSEQLESLEPVASRTELLTDEIQARFRAEAEKLAVRTAPEAAAERPAEAAEGSLNSIKTVAGTHRAGRQEDVAVTAGNDAGTATVSITEDAGATNGLIELSYDPAKLTFSASSIGNADVIVSVNPVYSTSGNTATVRIAYALTGSVSAGDLICALEFETACEGSDVIIKTIERSGQLGLSEQATKSVQGSGHAWGEPTYIWAADNSSVTASRICANDAAHVETETMSTTSAVTKPATCDTKGETTYTATFSNEAFTTQTKTVENIDALGHEWGAPTYVWSADNSSVTASRVCANDASHVETETKSTTSAVTKPATCEAKGETTYTATFSNAAFTTQTKTVENINALGHDWGEPTYTWAADYSSVTASRVCANDAAHIETETRSTTSAVTKPATCDAKGETTYTATFSSAAFTTQTKTVENIDALGHEWGAPTYVWSADNSSVTATVVCANDASHKVTETVETVYKVVKEATSDEDGSAAYTATFTNAMFTEQVRTVVLPALGHVFEFVDFTWTKTAEGYTAVANYRCTKEEGHNVSIEAAVSSEVTVAATCETAGTIVYTATIAAGVSPDNAAHSDTITDTIAAAGHDWSDPTYAWADDNSSVTATVVCRNDASHKITETVETVYKVVKEATADEDGSATYTATFTNAMFTEQVRTVVLPATGHEFEFVDFTWTKTAEGYTAVANYRCIKEEGHNVSIEAAVSNEVTVAAGCETAGNIVYTATVAADVSPDEAAHSDTLSDTIPAKGHTPGEPVIENETETTVDVLGGHDEVVYCTVCHAELSRTHVDDVVTIDAPVIESLTNGEVKGGITVTWTGDSKYGKFQIERREGANGEWTVISSDASATGYVDKKAETGGATYFYRVSGWYAGTWQTASEEGSLIRNPFTDVRTSVSYFKALMWAYNNGIVAGTSSTTFAPNDNCTRGQFALMLWRMNGKPDTTGLKNPFKDVSSKNGYYKGIIWCYDQGITAGTSATTYSPNENIPRWQMILMFWRMQGKPASTLTENPFTDVKTTASYYKAALWAYEKGITGVETFMPKDLCTRWQLVLFLYRLNELFHYI